MAKTGKITITVDSARRVQEIRWTGVGAFGSLNLSTTQGQVTQDPLISASTPDLWWKAVLTKVLDSM